MARHTIRRSLVIFTALLALFFSTVPGTGAAFRNLKEGSPAPAFALKDFEGKDVAYNPATGKVTVLSFVKLSQDRSRDELKDLAVLHKELSAKGVDFIALHGWTHVRMHGGEIACLKGLQGGEGYRPFSSGYHIRESR